jgi:hypothetical protein
MKTRVNGKRHPLFVKWDNMKQRCYNSNNKSYKHYGLRGVGVCDEWRYSYKEFHNFCINNGWQVGLEIARYGDIGDYEPNNVKFITREENIKERNDRTSIAVRCVELGIDFDSIQQAARYISQQGMSISKPRDMASNIKKRGLEGKRAYGCHWERI